MTTTPFDISQYIDDLSVGTHILKVKSSASGYEDSEFSNEISYRVYSISATAQNCTAAADNVTKIGEGTSVVLIYTFSGLYECPSTGPSVSGVTSTWTKVSETEGQLTLTNPSQNLSFTVSGKAKIFTITFANTANYSVTKTDGSALPNPFTISASGSASFKITANSGYVIGDTAAHAFSLVGAQVLTYAPVAGHGNATVSINQPVQDVTITLINVSAYTISGNITNGTLSGSRYISPYQGDAAQFSITPNSGYTYPSTTSISVTNASLTNYNESTGVGYVFNARGNVTITASCMVILTAPTISVTDDILSFIPGDVYTTSYDVYVDDGYETNVLVGNVLDLSTILMSTGFHAITARAKAAGCKTSVSSNTIMYEAGPQLAIPTNVSVTGTEVSFDAVDNAETYEFFVDGQSIGTHVPTSGYQVRISGSWYEGYPGDAVAVYDGTDSTGRLLTTILDSDDPFDVTVSVTSGYLYIDAYYYIDRGGYQGDCTGGVAYDSGEWVYTVTGDGAITNVSFDACLVEGTLVTLADGTQKPVEDITFDDDIKVWNFYEMKFDSAKPLWIMNKKTTDKYYKVTFEDGRELKLVGSNGKSHRLYDWEAKSFQYPQDMFPGPKSHHTYDDTGYGMHVLKIEEIHEPVNSYNIITNKHYNLYANGILTSCRLSNRYGLAKGHDIYWRSWKYDLNDVRMTQQEVDEYLEKLESYGTFNPNIGMKEGE